MNKLTTCVVAIKDEESFKNFSKNWEKELSQIANLVIVENNATHSFSSDQKNLTHLSWYDIDTDLGKNYWIIPRNSPALISYGCYKAIKSGAKNVIIIDENALPGEENIFQQHIDSLIQNEEEDSWHNILSNIKPKGVPFYNRTRKLPIMLNHGMWTENAVLDAAVQLSITSESEDINMNEGLVPKGSYFSLSNINMAFRADAAPLFYFLMMGTQNDFPFDGYGDIWCGVIAKKILDHLNWGCRSGHPIVINKKENNVWKSLKNDSNSLPVNESFWEKIDGIILTSDTPTGCYQQVAKTIGKWGHPYFQKLGQAMEIWIGLFTGEVPLHSKNEDDEAKSPSQLLSYINDKEPRDKRLNTETESILNFLHNKKTDSSKDETIIDPKEQTNSDAEITVNIIEDEENPDKDKPFVSSTKKLKLIKQDPAQGFIPRKK
ncbi:MAG: hypothetical protein NE334_01550 [Lentisphaeraceae bacterium]|nr:hypothetical protein [Lentisphaeraceae bacterium]